MTRRITATGIAIVLATGLAACASGHAGAGTPVSSASSPIGSVGAAPSAADLSSVLIRPAGFEAIPNDALSGPIQTPSDVRHFFTDHPDDPAEILDHGFTAGYAHFWQQTYTGSVTDPAFTTRPNADGIVIQFANADDATAVLEYFKRSNAADKYVSFDVPGSLPNGYGSYLVQPGQTANLTTYYYGVVWTRGSRLFNVSISYWVEPPSAADVIAYALAQDKADN